MEFISDICPVSALFGFIFGFGYLLFIGAVIEIHEYFNECKKVKRLRRDSLIICPFCGSYIGSGATFCCECGGLVKNK